MTRRTPDGNSWLEWYRQRDDASQVDEVGTPPLPFLADDDGPRCNNCGWKPEVSTVVVSSDPGRCPMCWARLTVKP